MADPLASLVPRALWGHFASIAAIPRPSKQEQRVADWVLGLAAERGLATRRDTAGNIAIDVPASRGREAAPIVILQGHLDMVCEKNKDTEHDFVRDPIRPVLDGEWIRAQGTTLGADNGIGVAAALAAATDPALAHGPLELLLTIDEETGLTGAKDLDPALLRGRTLVNLDSEEDGKLFVGCAGGSDCHLTLAGQREPQIASSWTYQLDVRGLRGGHSGIQIHENRGNALKLLTRVLRAAAAAGVDVGLARIAGGSKHNAIPREAEAVLTLDPAEEGRLRGVIACMLEGFRDELAGIDDGLTVELAPAALDLPVLRQASRDRLLDLLSALPHGVLAMSRDIPGLVETSSNLAVCAEGDDGHVRIVTSSRSSVASALRAVVDTIRAAAHLAGAAIDVHDGYPGWKPDLRSPVLAATQEVFTELWGRAPEVTAVHAGLECGLLGEKIPGLDMISFGPQIEGAHSPDERVSIPSVERFYTALGRLLDRLSR